MQKGTIYVQAEHRGSTASAENGALTQLESLW